MLSTSDRRFVLPLVCKQWHSLCCSAEIWSETGIELGKAEARTRFREKKKELLQQFFAKRSSGIKKFEIGLVLENADVAHGLLSQLKGSAQLKELALSVRWLADRRSKMSVTKEAGQLLTSAISGLSSLTALTCSNFQMYPYPGVPCFQPLRSLTSLRLCNLQLPEDELEQVYLPADISCLTSLQHLAIDGVSSISGHCLELVVDPWLSKLTSLTCLEFREEPLCRAELTGLTRLHTLEITCEAGMEFGLARAVKGLLSLQSISVYCEEIPEQLTALTRLTDLAFVITGCTNSDHCDSVLGRVLRSCQPLHLYLGVEFGYVPETLQSYAGLHHLEIDDGNLHVIPDGPYMSTIYTLDFKYLFNLWEIAEGVFHAPHLYVIRHSWRGGTNYGCEELRLRDDDGRNLLAAGHKPTLKAVSDFKNKLLDNKEQYNPSDWEL